MLLDDCDAFDAVMLLRDVRWLGHGRCVGTAAITLVYSQSYTTIDFKLLLSYVVLQSARAKRTIRQRKTNVTRQKEVFVKNMKIELGLVFEHLLR